MVWRRVFNGNAAEAGGLSGTHIQQFTHQRIFAGTDIPCVFREVFLLRFPFSMTRFPPCSSVSLLSVGNLRGMPAFFRSLYLLLLLFKHLESQILGIGLGHLRQDIHPVCS